MLQKYNPLPLYFDLIVVDEAHRSVHGALWRDVVVFFDCPQMGMTATPPRFADDATIEYFGDPIYIYDYEDGVRDELLAPAIIRRVKTMCRIVRGLFGLSDGGSEL